MVDGLVAAVMVAAGLAVGHSVEGYCKKDGESGDMN